MKTDRSFPSSVQIKNEWSYAYTPFYSLFYTFVSLTGTTLRFIVFMGVIVFTKITDIFLFSFNGFVLIMAKVCVLFDVGSNVLSSVARPHSHTFTSQNFYCVYSLHLSEGRVDWTRRVSEQQFFSASRHAMCFKFISSFFLFTFHTDISENMRLTLAFVFYNS